MNKQEHQFETSLFGLIESSGALLKVTVIAAGDCSARDNLKTRADLRNGIVELVLSHTEPLEVWEQIFVDAENLIEKAKAQIEWEANHPSLIDRIKFRLWHANRRNAATYL